MAVQQKIIFVTGKGGVGKSLMAAAIARSWVKKGKSTLLVELNNHSFFQDFLNLGPVGYDSVETPLGFRVAQWSGEQALKDYVQFLVKVPAVAKLFFENPVSKTLIQIAPALKELAILGKITSAHRHHGPPATEEIIVVDAFATGHFLNLLGSPEALGRAVPFGPMGEQCRSITTTIHNPELVSYYVVCLPEELPVTETIELCQKLYDRHRIQPTLIMNKTFNFSQQIETEARGKSEFQKFILAKSQQQKKYCSELSKTQLQVLQAPFEPEDQCAVLVEKLSEVFK